jgi:photosystem II stability/assembly factor-like uncharacterized protein
MPRFRPAAPTGLLALAVAILVAFAPAPAAAQVAPDHLSAMQARSIGPAGMSGRITAIAALESDPMTVYAGAASGGVWKSTNGGDTWRPLFDDQRVANIGAIAVHQGTRDVVWVGTGEGNPRNSADPGAGIYRSVDGGETWTFLGLEETRQIHRILLHPTDPDVAWVGALGPIWSAGEERGVYRTTDGGETWEKVLYIDEDTGVAEMVQDPVNPNKIFAAMWSFRRWPWYFESGYGEGSGLYVTYDGGDSWEELDEAAGLPDSRLGRMGLAIARSNPDWVYALVEAEDDGGLYLSTDGGRSFELINDENGVLNRPFYYAEIHVDPTNHLRVYNLSSIVRVSDDGGRSFERMPNDVHSDFHAMWIEPTRGELIYLGNDGGFVISQDRAQNWRVTDNLPVGQFYHISVDMAVPFNVYGGMQDNGSWKGPSDKWNVDGIRNWEWSEIGFGDGFNAMVDPTSPMQGFGMSQGGSLYRWDNRTGERKPVRPYHPDDSVELRFHWNAALASDPHDPGTFYYGSQFLHRTRDQGGSWEVLSPDLTTDDPEKQKYDESGGITRDATGAENHTTILTIAPSPVEEGVIWVGTDDGNVQLTRDDGATWTNFADEMDGPAPNTWVPHIEASKHVAGRAYVVLEDHRRGGWEPWIFMTDDFGRNWRNIANGRNGEGIDGYVHTVEEDPVNPDLLYAGSELGLWISLDRGESWFKWTHGFPTVPVRSLVVHPRDHDLAIGTFGRAIYILDDVRPLREMTGGAEPAAVTLFPTPDAYLQRIAAMNGYHFSGDAMFKGETRMRGAMLSYWIPEDGPGGDAQIEILDAAGAVIRAFDGPGEPGLNRTRWDLRVDAPGGDEGGGGRFGRAFGPEVVPGEYTVRVSVAEERSEQPLTVLPDPRVEIPMADRVAKFDAQMEALELNARRSEMERVVREVNQAADRVIAAVRGLEDEGARELGRAGRELKRTLEEEVDFGPANSQRRSLFSMGSSWDAPTEGELLALRRTAAALDEIEAALTAFLAGPVAEFRTLTRAAELDLFPEIRMDGGGN